MGSLAPGNELVDRFSSKSADIEGSNNILGIKNAAVDALLDEVISAHSRPELAAALKSLDRVLRFEHLTVTHWYSPTHRVAYWNHRFAEPSVMPLYYQPENWILSTWWARQPGK